MTKPSTPIDHPPYYNYGTYEVIDVIEDWRLDFNLGNVIKYVGRCGHKGDTVGDLKKAKWYLEREIAILEKRYAPYVPDQDAIKAVLCRDVKDSFVQK